MVNSIARAIRVEEYGDVSVLKSTTIPRPIIRPDQALVKVAYAGINYGDLGQRSGSYLLPLPFTLGGEGSGEIVEVGSEIQHGFKVGDRVTFLARGAYADYVAVDTILLGKLPDGVSLEVGAAFLVQGLTGVALVEKSYAIQRGDWVVVHAAAGGTGLVLTQLAHRLGAHVIGTVSTEEKAAIARANGAEHVVLINNGYKVFEQKVKELTNGQGVHAVYDSIGQATFESSLNIVRRLGTLVLYGNTSGHVPPLEVYRLAGKNVKLVWTSIYNHLTTREEFDELYDKTLEQLEKDQLKFQISKIYAYDEVKQAHLDLEGRKTTGKLLLKIN